MLNEVLTFIFFLLIGLEIRDGLSHAKEAVLPTIAALGGMIVPAVIFLSLIPGSKGWAIAMPTDVALAIGTLSILGKRINPQVRLFLLTLAVADDFFSLVVLGIFFREDMHLASAIYTIGAATIGFVLPFRAKLISLLGPICTFAIVPIYIAINLFAHLDFSVVTSKLTLAIVAARVIGKVAGITFFAWLTLKLRVATLPLNLDLKEIAGVGILAGMGMTVSLVIAEIALVDSQLANVRMGLLIAAVLSGVTGLLWFKRFPASL